MADPLAALQDRLGHRFANRALLEEALVHGSVDPRRRDLSNERLEFLGDRVLGLTIAAALYAADPRADEGLLARRLNALVRRETCAERAVALGIGEALTLGASEMQAGGRRKTAILADACEAVLAAVYLDAGYGAAERVVRHVWAPLLGEEPERDPKTELQERLQARGEDPPSYEVRERTGPDHAPRFVIEAVGGAGVLGVGGGRSKREAEAEAARAALEAMWGEGAR